MILWVVRVLRARALRQCVRCGDPSTSSRCPACQAQVNDYLTEHRDQNRSRGRCRCGQPPMPGYEQCGDCYTPRGGVSGWPRGRPRKPEPCK